MSNFEIPDDIQAFIVQYLDSIAKVEALTLLRSDPDRSWKPDELAARLYITPGEAKAVLEGLQGAGLLTAREVGFQYRCEDRELGAKAGKAVELYRTHLIAVTNLIHARGVRRIQQFADAFKLRKDK